MGSIEVSIRRPLPLSLDLMSAPIPYLTGLPTEILEQILLNLPGQDIVKMEVVRGAVSNSGDPVLTLCFCGPGQSTVPGPDS